MKNNFNSQYIPGVLACQAHHLFNSKFSIKPPVKRLFDLVAPHLYTYLQGARITMPFMQCMLKTSIICNDSTCQISPSALYSPIINSCSHKKQPMKTLDDASNCRRGSTMSPLQLDIENKITTAYLYSVTAKGKHLSLAQFLGNLTGSPIEKQEESQITKIK